VPFSVNNNVILFTGLDLSDFNLPHKNSCVVYNYTEMH